MGLPPPEKTKVTELRPDTGWIITCPKCHGEEFNVVVQGPDNRHNIIGLSCCNMGCLWSVDVSYVEQTIDVNFNPEEE